MKNLDMREALYLKFAIDNLLERAEKIEKVLGVERSTFRNEAEVLQKLLERGTNGE